jgi:hypothetical protein
MSFSTKLLPILARVASMAPLASQARNGDPRLMHQANIMQTSSDCWVTNFGFRAANGKLAVCTNIQKGFWPRPERLRPLRPGATPAVTRRIERRPEMIDQEHAILTDSLCCSFGYFFAEGVVVSHLLCHKSLFFNGL